MNGYNRNLHFSISWPGRSQRKCSVSPPLRGFSSVLGSVHAEGRERVQVSLGGHPANTDVPGVGFEADRESVHSAGAPAVPLALLGPSTACLSFLTVRDKLLFDCNGAGWPHSRRKELWPCFAICTSLSQVKQHPRLISSDSCLVTGLVELAIKYYTQYS